MLLLLLITYQGLHRIIVNLRNHSFPASVEYLWMRIDWNGNRCVCLPIGFRRKDERTPGYFSKFRFIGVSWGISRWQSNTSTADWLCSFVFSVISRIMWKFKCYAFRVNIQKTVGWENFTLDALILKRSLVLTVASTFGLFYCLWGKEREFHQSILLV